MVYSHIVMPFTLAYSYGKTALHLTKDYTLRQYSKSNINYRCLTSLLVYILPIAQ